jgi:acyl-CoA synthetase (NDP forming)
MTTVKKPGEFGIKETSDIFDLTDEIIRSVKNSKENDGKVDWKDIPNFLSVPMKLIAAVNGIEKVDDELTDLDAAETAELEARISKYAKNPRYAKLVGHLLEAANEIAAIARGN